MKTKIKEIVKKVNDLETNVEGAKGLIILINDLEKLLGHSNSNNIPGFYYSKNGDGEIRFDKGTSTIDKLKILSLCCKSIIQIYTGPNIIHINRFENSKNTFLKILDDVQKSI